MYEAEERDLRTSCHRLFSYMGQNPGAWVVSAERLKKSA